MTICHKSGGSKGGSNIDALPKLKLKVKLPGGGGSVVEVVVWYGISTVVVVYGVVAVVVVYGMVVCVVVDVVIYVLKLVVVRVGW